MSDEADMAGHHEELERDAALRLRRRSGPQYTGFCANCGETIKHPMRWCNAECREDWELREKK